MRTLVIGNGLIGSALSSHDGCTPLLGVPWANNELAQEIISEACLAWMLQGGPWAIAWCAGTGVVGTGDDALLQERACFDAILRVRPRGHGRVLLTSSGGGLYGNGTPDVINEYTDPNPTSRYGWAKLSEEMVLRIYSNQWGVPVMIVRPSNVYGPYQNPSKPQGLISKMLRCLRDGTPLGLTVPLSTSRDYIFANDVGHAMARLLEEEPAEQVDVRLVASGVSHSIEQVIVTAEKITGRKLKIETGSPNMDQPHRLAFASTFGSSAFTSLQTGMTRTWNHLQGNR